MSTKFRPITHIITGTGPVNPWPPTGSYLLCARLYTNTFLDHITLNTVSWSFDSGSSPTYADANCTQQLYDLSSWNDSSPNTVLQTIGQNEYGTYVDIFTDGVGAWGDESATDFCIILGNDNVQTITDDSWKITRVEVYKVGMTNGIYRTNNSPYKGEWFRDDSSAWTEFPLTPSSSTKFRPLSVFEVQPEPTISVVLMPDGKYWTDSNLTIDDGGEGIWHVDDVSANGYNFGTQYYYTLNAVKRVVSNISGYHLPSEQEWQDLMSSIGGIWGGSSLKSTYGWDDKNGNDTYNFKVLPITPYNIAQGYKGAGFDTQFIDYSGNTYYLSSSTNMIYKSYDGGDVAYSIRLIKDT